MLQQILSKFHLDKLKGLQTFLFLFLSIAILKGSWQGDFWEHAAIIKQFSYSSTDTHPLFNLKVPHAFYSPYLFALGYVVKFTALSTIGVLAIAGFINMAIFLYILPKFIQSFNLSRNIAFYTILFYVFYWYFPLNFSGFYSINNLVNILPYPSTSAFILTLVTLLYYKKSALTKIYPIFIISILSATIILTHPITGIFLLAALFSIQLNKDGIKPTKQWVLLSATVVIIAILVLSWPHYSFMELALGGSSVYHDYNKNTYISPLLRTFPAILALPAIIYSLITYKDKTLTYLFILLSSIYIYGYFSEKWSYGRSLSYIVLISDIFLATFLIAMKTKFGLKMNLLLTLIIILTFITFAYRNINFNSFLPLNAWNITTQKYKNLSAHLSENDIVFSTTEESWPIPSFGPKIVSALHPQAFIQDADIRREETDLFFNTSNLSDTERWDIINKYEVNKILIPASFKASSVLEKWLARNSVIIFRDSNFMLYQIETN